MRDGNAQVNTSSLRPAKRKRLERDRMRNLGFIQLTAWVHEADIKRIRKQLLRLKAKHTGADEE